MNAMLDLFVSVMVSGVAVTGRMTFASNHHVVDELRQGWRAPIQGLEKVLNPEALEGAMPFWDIWLWFPCLGAIEHESKNET